MKSSLKETEHIAGQAETGTGSLAEFREIFSGLDKTGQDRLLDTARALFFATRTHTREEKCKSPIGKGQPLLNKDGTYRLLNRETCPLKQGKAAAYKRKGK